MAFSGGSYGEVARWLENFLRSHTKREDPRIEVELDQGDGREGHSYGARLALDDRVTPLMELDYTEVAANRGSLQWCRGLADRARGLVREHLLGGDSAPETSSARR